MSARREPVPDPDKASEIKIRFEKPDAVTKVHFEHYNFENHGQEWKNYENMMQSEQGWPYILDQFKAYCELQG
ncbi:SRPBCC domain-containing protein [Saccharicrinis sp. FJH54]|uniref:SRPBCC domain-containing protein n=1 Tax=Saccharicrinis sp. FJH54 TaxID=3344665 RepID=UPI0035D4F32C